ncbi:MAG: hypothetical protein LBI91_01890 [Spirochaetaceae bacterium]|jgi:hypothetical protein|nr:hypothetical protein [Spirochaetaceae bacterium]
MINSKKTPRPGKNPWLKKTAQFIFILQALCIPVKSFAADYTDGRIRLALNENTGRFALYYLTDRDTRRFDPLFSEQDTRTSSLSVRINDRIYKMGETPSFAVRIGGTQAKPALIFESAGMIVTEEFTFLSVNGQPETTGVRLNIRIENKGSRAGNVGARLIIDTNLGESANTGANHFTTDERGIGSEALFDAKWPDKWWVSRNSSYGLMGSINTGYSSAADYVHFANWKRLSDSSWELMYNRRNFTNPPYSINDSAVSYVFNPQRLPAGESRSYTVLLAAADESGFGRVTFKPEAAPARAASLSGDSEQKQVPPGTGSASRPASEEETMRTDLVVLRDLLARLDDYMAGRNSLSDEEIINIELIINRIKDRYR